MTRSSPLVSFHCRADGLIDLYSIVRLDEKTVWQAIIDTGIGCEDWTARKEYDEQTWPVLRFYIEQKQEVDAQEMARLIHERLQALDPFYAEAIGEVETNPVSVTLLSKGSFQRYYEDMQKCGTDLAHLKPPHMNASDAVIKHLTTAGAD